MNRSDFCQCTEFECIGMIDWPSRKLNKTIAYFCPFWRRKLKSSASFMINYICYLRRRIKWMSVNTSKKGPNSKFSYISSLPDICQLVDATELYLMMRLPFLRLFFTFLVADVYRRWKNVLIHRLENCVYYGWHMRSSLKLSEPVSSPSFLVIFAHSSTPSLELQLL